MHSRGKEEARRQDTDEETPTEPLELDLDMSPEDEAALRQEAERNYREWMAMIGEKHGD